MQRIIGLYIFLYLYLLSFPSFSQENTCEYVTNSAIPKIVAALKANDFDELELAIQPIEDVCGNNEITQRLRIMGLLIQQKSTNDAIQSYLKAKMDDDLIIRLDGAVENNYASIYNKGKKTFNFVPLRHAIDSLIQIKAITILHSEAYDLQPTEEAITYLFSGNINIYLIRMHKERPATPADRMEQIEVNKGRYSMVFHVGLQTPIYAITPIFKTNPVYGISFISPLTKNWIFDGSLKIRTNNSDGRAIEYDQGDRVASTVPSSSFMLGGSVGYKFLDRGKFLVLGKAGLAWELVNTGLAKGAAFRFIRENTNHGLTRSHIIHTYNASAGLSAMQHVSGRLFVGIQAQYHYIPYNMDDRLLTPIVSDYGTFEIFFRF